MTTAAFREEGLMLSGTVFFRLLDADTQGFEEIGNTTDMKLTLASKTIERVSKKKGSTGNVLDSVILPEPAKFELTIDTFNPQNLSMALMGTLGYQKQTSEKITDEVVTAETGRWLKLAKSPIKKGSVKIKLANSSPVADEKFQVNEDMGMIFLEESAGATKGEKIKVTYDTEDSDKWTIEAGTKNQFKCEFLFDGINLATNRAVQLRISRAAIAASGSVSFIGDNFNNMSFAGTAELVSGNNSPVILTMA